MGLGQSGLLSHGLLPVSGRQHVHPLPLSLHSGAVHRHLPPHEGPGQYVIQGLHDYIRVSEVHLHDVEGPEDHPRLLGLLSPLLLSLAGSHPAEAQLCQGIRIGDSLI